MKELCVLLLALALERHVTDIHLTSEDDHLSVAFRADEYLEVLDQDLFDGGFLEYLKFISGMDLCSPSRPQSGDFEMDVFGKQIQCRFSMMRSETSQSGVIRLLQASHTFALSDLTGSKEALERLDAMSKVSHGLILSCGPTGSGKSTTVHALLNRILKQANRKIVTLEDPVEIREPGMVQIQVNAAQGISYESGIEELLRNDVDVFFFGECRSAYSAKMALRASLTGHVVYTTLHCGSGLECLYRLMDLGIDEQELKSVLKGVFICRLERKEGRKESLYEIWNEDDLETLFKEKEKARPGLSFETCRAQCEACANQ